MAGKTGPSLQLGQRQSLVMTPQLQQSIQLLQMSALDLMDFVDQQLSENPLLQPGDDVPVHADNEQPEPSSETLNADQVLEVTEVKSDESRLQAESMLDVDDSTNWQEQASSGSAEEAGYWDLSPSKRNHDAIGSTDNWMEQTIASEITLKDHLRDQLHVMLNDPQEQIIGMALVDALDDTGYMQDDVASLAEILGVSAQEVEEVRTLLTACEPTGVFARDLAECLGLQLAERDRLDPAMAALLRHLDLLGRGDITTLCRRCGVDQDDMMDMLSEIRELNPKPGLDFASESVDSIQPDVKVIPDGKGGWHIRLIQERLPKVLVDREYYAQVTEQTTRKEDKRYLSEQWQHANWLVKALDQRANTILKVTSEIVAQQSMFFKYGVRYLKPMTLKQVAEKVDLHESTVSRVTAQKYMLTPRGVLELKYFFTSGVQNESGGGVSSEAIKSQIKALIEQEEVPKDVLSDDKIAEILQRQGIDIARRTIAKYREAMHFGSSVERRRALKLR